MRSRAALTLAGIAVNGIDYGTDAAALRRILADPRLPTPVRGDIRLSMGLLMVNHAGDRAGIREIARAAQELADRPDRAARAMVALAMDERDGEAGPAKLWLDRAEDQARLSGDEAVRAAVRATRLTLRARDGDPSVWQEVDLLPRHAEDDAVLRQTARALFNIGELAMELGHDRRAARMLAESRDLARRVSVPPVESYSRIALLRLDFLAGRWTDLEKRFRDLCHEYPDIVLAATEEAIVVGRLSAALGRRSRAVSLLTAAAAYGESESQVTVTLRAAARLAELRLAEDAPRDAWAVAAPAVTTLRRSAAWARATGLVPAAVEAAMACGARRASERLVAETEAGLAGLGRAGGGGRAGPGPRGSWPRPATGPGTRSPRPTRSRRRAGPGWTSGGRTRRRGPPSASGWRWRRPGTGRRRCGWRRRSRASRRSGRPATRRGASTPRATWG